MILCVIALVFTLNSGVIEEEFGSYNGEESMFLDSLLINFFPVFLGLLAFYFGIRYTIKKIEKKNLTYNATKDLLHYRDTFDDMTPFEVSILANLNVEEKKDVVATIL